MISRGSGIALEKGALLYGLRFRQRWTAARALAYSSFAGALNPADGSHPEDADQYDLNDQKHSYL